MIKLICHASENVKLSEICSKFNKKYNKKFESFQYSDIDNLSGKYRQKVMLRLEDIEHKRQKKVLNFFLNNKKRNPGVVITSKPYEKIEAIMRPKKSKRKMKVSHINASQLEANTKGSLYCNKMCQIFKSTSPCLNSREFGLFIVTEID